VGGTLIDLDSQAVDLDAIVGVHQARSDDTLQVRRVIAEEPGDVVRHPLDLAVRGHLVDDPELLSAISRKRSYDSSSMSTAARMGSREIQLTASPCRR